MKRREADTRARKERQEGRGKEREEGEIQGLRRNQLDLNVSSPGFPLFPLPSSFSFLSSFALSVSVSSCSYAHGQRRLTRCCAAAARSADAHVHTRDQRRVSGPRVAKRSVLDERSGWRVGPARRRALTDDPLPCHGFSAPSLFSATPQPRPDHPTRRVSPSPPAHLPPLLPSPLLPPPRWRRRMRLSA